MLIWEAYLMRSILDGIYFLIEGKGIGRIVEIDR